MVYYAYIKNEEQRSTKNSNKRERTYLLYILYIFFVEDLLTSDIFI